MSFETNVFINCPFDEDYKPILKAIVFTTLYLGFEPQISKTVSSSHIRIAGIIDLIKASKYSIHDISRCEPLAPGELPRFNMPYEMGLDVGCITYGNKKQKTKLCLILEKEKNRYDTVISDISGQDIKEHGDSPQKVIERLIEWFSANDGIGIIPSPQKVWSLYLECIAKIADVLMGEGYSEAEIDNLPIPQFIKAMKPAILGLT